MKLQVIISPLDAYFLGTERNASYQGETNSQQSELNPYFIRSGKYPSQSALFGILRYLGIQNPKANFSIDQDKDNIGDESYNLLSEAEQSFGRIQKISALMLTDRDGRRYIPAPRCRQAAEWDEEKKTADFNPVDEYSTVASIDGVRYLPNQYDEKKSWDDAELLCLDDGKLYPSPFSTKVQVGINRQSQKEDVDKREISGFFKKEYVILNPDYSFLFYAEVADDFWYRENSIAYVGQGRTPFAVHMEPAKDGQDTVKFPAECFPVTVQVNGEAHKFSYAVAISDCYYSGEISALKNACSLMIADSRDYRGFTTNYSKKVKGNYQRYTKNDQNLKLLKAGSVFLFFGSETQTPAEQMADFQNKIHNSQAEIAGFNQFYFSK